MQTPSNPSGLLPATLNITTADVLGVLNRIIDVDGLDAARVAFKQMNEFFSGMWGWAETTNEVYALFAAVRRREHKEQFEKELAKERAGAASFVWLNQNKNLNQNQNQNENLNLSEAIGIRNVDQLNGVIEEGAEVSHTKHE